MTAEIAERELWIQAMSGLNALWLCHTALRNIYADAVEVRRLRSQLEAVKAFLRFTYGDGRGEAIFHDVTTGRSVQGDEAPQP